MLFSSTQPCIWFDFGSWRAPRDLSLDPVLRALPRCPHLKTATIMTDCTCPDAMTNLLQLQSATSLRLVLKTDHWLAMADEVRRGRCNVRSLTLIMLPASRSEATEVVKAVASAIRLDHNLEHLKLEMEEKLAMGDDFSNEAGLALAEALTVNKTLRMITLFEATNFGAQAYNAFIAMLRVNTSLVLEPPSSETGGGGESLCESHKQMIIEQRLNKVGRGKLLSSSQTTREE